MPAPHPTMVGLFTTLESSLVLFAIPSSHCSFFCEIFEAVSEKRYCIIEDKIIGREVFVVRGL